MFEDWAPTLWVHGHTHEAFDYRINDTRVIVNPRAYPNEVSSTALEFAWDRVIEV
jgi:Icc-related predicted phosphoesterase